VSHCFTKRFQLVILDQRNGRSFVAHQLALGFTVLESLGFPSNLLLTVCSAGRGQDACDVGIEGG
jgi:hypothetical protein